MTTTTPEEIIAARTAVRAGSSSGKLRQVEDRKEVLQQLKLMITENVSVWLEALHNDLGKPEVEASLTETSFVTGDISHTLKNLDDWTKPRSVPMPALQRPGWAKVVPQPVGTVLIISPWNYPLQLVMAPLVAAIAAGNTAVVKPSEMAPNTAFALAEMLPKYVDDSIVQVVTGGVAEATALLEQQWDHIMYTGNATIGRIVMEAAAKHLTPVTLELGGKSPAIVTTKANLTVAAKRIAWGKFLNAGQTCVAPDYVLVESEVADNFTRALTDAIRQFYGADPQESTDYGRIVNARHHSRLVGLLDAGGYDQVVRGGEHDADNLYIAPTVLSGVDQDADVMNEEIFGPILPIITVDSVDQAVGFINDREHPLALYVFTEDDDESADVLARTTSGSAVINHCVQQTAVPELPFGGVGQSGIGAYHGQTGFDTFSHLRAVLNRSTRVDPAITYPPYTSLKKRLLGWLV